MKLFFSIVVSCLLTAIGFAQSPQKMSYQAVIRNSNDALVTNTDIGMQISILQGSPTGTPVFVEQHSATTNSNGLISIEIGTGTLVSGDFQTIDWSGNMYFLKTETDITGGTDYTITGTSQLLSVPYAFHAKTAERISGDLLETDPETNFQTLSISNDTLFLSNGGFVKLPTFSLANLLPPKSKAKAVTNMLVHTATLNGLVNPNGLSTTVEFEYGRYAFFYESTVNATPITVTGTTDVAVRANISGLEASRIYYYRIKATNAVNTSYSDTLFFETKWPEKPTVTTSNISDIKGISAKAGGTIINNGGSPVTAQGLCWSTSPNPEINNSFTKSFTETMTGLLPDTIYYVRAYATNLAGTGYGNQISFNSGKTYGTSFGGGLVFYNDGNGHGMVSSPADQSSFVQWGCEGTLIGTQNKIYSGSTNTKAILAKCTTPGIAAYIADTLTLGGYTDWFLPSIDELNLMYLNLHKLGFGGFKNIYISSSEWNDPAYPGNERNNVWVHSFTYGTPGWGGKEVNESYFTRGMRAIREF